MCVYIAIFTITHAVMLWCMDSAAALQCNGYRLKAWLAGHLDKSSVQCGGVYTRNANFFNLTLKLTNYKCPMAR